MIVRADLPRGIQAANIAHAAGESSPGDLPAGTHAVVLTTPSEPALEAVATMLRLKSLEFVRIEEVDAPFTGQLMALGLRPRAKEVLRRHLSSLPLLK